MSQIHQVPSGKIPTPSVFGRMLEADDQMHRIVGHFVGRDLWLEVKRAETALAAAGGIELWVEVKNALARCLDDSQIRVT